MKVLVTGGTGFLGEHVIRQLLERGEDEVTSLARSRSPILDALPARGGRPIEQIRGDVSSGPELAEALRGCEGVFHLAGIVSRDPDDGQRMMRVHVDGTRRLLRLAAEAGVRRVVVASSSGTIAVSEHATVHDERSDYATELVSGWAYYASKIYQEKVALELGSELGLEVVVVSPSLLLGPGDRRLSSTRDVLRFLRRQIPVVPDGGINFVDVRDTASATLAAMTKGKSGERYLLGGPNWTFAEFFARLERTAKIGGPRLKLPRKLQTFGASVVEHVYRARGKEPPLDRESVEMGQHYWWIDSSKAERELDFQHRDPSLTLVDTVAYLRQSIAADL